jgi:hypothetical protein
MAVTPHEPNPKHTLDHPHSVSTDRHRSGGLARSRDHLHEHARPRIDLREPSPGGADPHRSAAGTHVRWKKQAIARNDRVRKHQRHRGQRAASRRIDPAHPARQELGDPQRAVGDRERSDIPPSSRLTIAPVRLSTSTSWPVNCGRGQSRTQMDIQSDPGALTDSKGTPPSATPRSPAAGAPALAGMQDVARARIATSAAAFSAGSRDPRRWRSRSSLMATPAVGTDRTDVYAAAGARRSRVRLALPLMTGRQRRPPRPGATGSAAGRPRLTTSWTMSRTRASGRSIRGVRP